MKVIRIRIEDDIYNILRKKLKKGDLSAWIRRIIKLHLHELETYA